jgi:hypothetical protein
MHSVPRHFQWLKRPNVLRVIGWCADSETNIRLAATGDPWSGAVIQMQSHLTSIQRFISSRSNVQPACRVQQLVALPSLDPRLDAAESIAANQSQIVSESAC